MRGNRFFKFVDRWLGVPLVALLGAFRSRPEPRPLGPGQRVLVIKQSAMGDTLLLLPVIKALKEMVGEEGVVDVLATRVNAVALKDVKGPDHVRLFEPSAMLLRPWRLASFFAHMRRRRYDWALDFDQWLRSSALLALASGAKHRGGFNTPGQHKHALFHKSAANHRAAHEFEQFKDVAALAGLDRAKVEPFAGYLLREAYLGAQTLPRSPRPLVLLHPGVGGKRGWQREWPLERYMALGRWLKLSLHVDVCLSGAGAHEAGLCAAIEAAIGPSKDSCVNTGLPSLVKALCKADLVICGNTGVMHMAAGLGRPVVALHGPNPHVKWGPLGPQEQVKVILAKVPCSPCLNLGFEFGCPIRPCMESITVEETAEAARAVLEARA